VLAVFARFEAVVDVSLRPGECVEVAKMSAGTQSDSNLEGQWVAGTLDRPSGLVTVIRTPGAPSDDHKPVVFHLNGKPFSRWYYEWESGANKAQRLTKHVLKVRQLHGLHESLRPYAAVSRAPCRGIARVHGYLISTRAHRGV
jgi:hypothetical protein